MKKGRKILEEQKTVERGKKKQKKLCLEEKEKKEFLFEFFLIKKKGYIKAI